MPQDQHQQYSMQKARSTDAVPCSSGGKRYGMDPSRLQGSDSETEQQHSSQQPQRGQMHNGQPTTRKRPASAAGTQASRDRPTSPLAAAAAALRPVLGQQHAAAAQPSRGSQQAVSMQQRQQQEQQHSAVQPADAAQPAAARQAPPPAPQPRPPPAFVKGQPVWYRQRDGAEVEASVESVDLTVHPPSFGVLLPGRSEARETVAERLRPRGPAGGGGSAVCNGSAQAAGPSVKEAAT